ncbi:MULTISPECIES: hypothetical protein [Pandoraea]|uniref:hypothetical protein n=1 Tax=Pandoraea TaxID=93217 RepID=UPI001E423BD4|nr:MULTISPECIES: hypothetical protein [Pandoraea]
MVPNPCRNLTREMLYTAQTRQRDKIIILHQGDFRDPPLRIRRLHVHESLIRPVLLTTTDAGDSGLNSAHSTPSALKTASSRCSHSARKPSH